MYVNYLPDNLDSNDIYTHMMIVLTMFSGGDSGSSIESANNDCRRCLFFRSRWERRNGRNREWFDG